MSQCILVELRWQRRRWQFTLPFCLQTTNVLITLTTDFGVSSPYVAAMKGSLLSICRNVELIDITHAIPPQDVRQAAVVLADVTPVFPRGTLHVAVIDPGVGTERRIVYAEIGDQRYLAPDNGLLSYLTHRVQPHLIVEVTNRSYWREAVSNTFHGRDIFAPVAGHLASGLAPDDLGSVTNQLVDLDWPEPQYLPDQALGEVLYIDSFGNIITNLSLEELFPATDRADLVVSCNGHDIAGLQTTYGQRRSEELIALGDSQGRLEIARVNGNAAALLAAKAGDAVRVWQRSGERLQS